MAIKSQKKGNILDLPLEEVKGIGPGTAKILGRLEIKNVRDLLEYYPYRYEDYSTTKTISRLSANEAVTIKATVTSIQNRRALKNKRLSITEAILTDNTGNISAVWFNQPFLITTLQKGRTYYFSGTTVYRGKLQLSSPQFEMINGQQTSVGRIVPVYSLPEGIAAKRYRAILYHLLENIPDEYDTIPEDLRDQLNLAGLKYALTQIHFPGSFEELNAARERLGFDELLNFQLQILERREFLNKNKSPKIPFNQQKIRQFVDSLPFKLTLSQKKGAWEIIQDLEKDKPMNRLLQGDVGSGKTVVAAIAAYSAALAGYQTALLAPTEILAQQHFNTLNKLLEPNELVIATLTGSTPKKEKEGIYKAIKNGNINIVVGTHAVLGEQVEFKNLGLLIVDEQHRFGVKQRATLREAQNGKLMAHLLSMTATPIPRTLALTLYGDLDISSITEMPPGRAAIQTEIIPKSDRQKAYALIRRQILSGRQAFVICPLLEESDVLEVKSATAEQQRLAKIVFPNFSVGLIHGRMAGKEKEKVMDAFKEGEYHLLVSTSVVEVGIDVPNATVMLIEGAERFGLAQLHQFRGRVGRGEYPSYCLLVPSSSNIPQRLTAVCKYNDGFKLAEMDLKFRGMGNLSGIAQHGFLDLKIADPGDIEAVSYARKVAEKLIKDGIEKYPEIQKLLRQKESIVHPE